MENKKLTIVKTNKFKAYSLYEMLIVFIIISLILLAMPPIIKKLKKLTYVRHPHGRYECWWETENGRDVLKEYFVEETAAGVIIGGGEPETVPSGEYCMFNPPKNPAYIILNAIGGGGAGAQLPIENGRDLKGNSLKTLYKNQFPSDVTNPDPAMVYNGRRIESPENRVNNGVKDGFWLLWPEWLKKYYDMNGCGGTRVTGVESTTCKLDSNLCNSSNIDTYVSYDYVILGYRSGGEAGKVSTIFTPSIPRNAILYIKPGKGGKVSSEQNAYQKNGQNGEDTKVEVNNNTNAKHCFDDENTCTADCCILLTAKGGTGGKLLDADNNMILSSETVVKTGGAPTDFGLSSFPTVLGKKASFEENIDNISNNEALKSKVVDKGLGNGGRGANHYAKNTSGSIKFTYKTQATVRGAWGTEKSNIAGCFTDSNIAKKLNHVNEDLYESQCSSQPDGNDSKLVCNSVLSTSNPCKDGSEHGSEPSIQNGYSVCAAKDGNHGGVVIIW